VDCTNFSMRIEGSFEKVSVLVGQELLRKDIVQHLVTRNFGDVLQLSNNFIV
jgi:hypothetical protein